MSKNASHPFIRHQDLPSEAVPVIVDVLTASDWARFSQNLTPAPSGHCLGHGGLSV